jgi:hypothetical protein
MSQTPVAPIIESKDLNRTAIPGISAPSARATRVVVAIALIIFAAILLSPLQRTDYTSPQWRNSDAYTFWRDGKAIAYGLNPYSRIEGGDLQKNNKYTTYFPGFFLALSAAIHSGLISSFEQFIAFWLMVNVVLVLTIGAVLYGHLSEYGGIVFGTFGAVFFILNRWTLDVMRLGHLDILALLFLVLSLVYYDKRPRCALMCFGISLAIKQIAIFLLPVYLALSYRAEAPWQVNLRSLMQTLLWISIIPLVTIFPFLIWDGRSFVRSILFSATRLTTAGSFHNRSIDTYYKLSGFTQKLPMLLVLGLCYFCVLLRCIPLRMAALFVMLIFIGFNSLLFRQYMVWFVPLVSLAALDAYRQTAKYMRYAQPEVPPLESKLAI